MSRYIEVSGTLSRLGYQANAKVNSMLHYLVRDCSAQNLPAFEAALKAQQKVSSFMAREQASLYANLRHPFHAGVDKRRLAFWSIHRRDPEDVQEAEEQIYVPLQRAGFDPSFQGAPMKRALFSHYLQKANLSDPKTHTQLAGLCHFSLRDEAVAQNWSRFLYQERYDLERVGMLLSYVNQRELHICRQQFQESSAQLNTQALSVAGRVIRQINEIRLSVAKPYHPGIDRAQARRVWQDEGIDSRFEGDMDSATFIVLTLQRSRLLWPRDTTEGAGYLDPIHRLPARHALAKALHMQQIAHELHELELDRHQAFSYLMPTIREPRGSIANRCRPRGSGSVRFEASSRRGNTRGYPNGFHR